MIQLLLDININIVVSESKVTDKEHSKPQLIGEGCLEPALGLLALCKERKGDNWDKLHLSLVKLIYRLWDSASLLATRHLKDTPEFWMNLCWPLYDVRYANLHIFITFDPVRICLFMNDNGSLKS